VKRVHCKLSHLMGRDAVGAEKDGRLIVSVGGRELDLPGPGLFGPHQFENAALAVVAVLRLNHPGIDEAAIGRGVAGAVWPGRFQELTRDISVGALQRLAPDCFWTEAITPTPEGRLRHRLNGS